MLARQGRLWTTVGYSVFLVGVLGCTSKTQNMKSGGSGGAQNGQEMQQPVSSPNSVAQPNAPQAVSPQAQTTTGVQTAQDEQDKYPAYAGPSSQDLSNPNNAIIYNGTGAGITSINGRALATVVPPGSAVVVPKRYADISRSTGMYTLRVTTDKGQSGSAKFDPSTVNQGGWRASVSMNSDSNKMEIKQNAGGGGGGDDDGGGDEDLDNFVD